MMLKKLLVGKKSLQPLYKKLHNIALRGMNYGLGGMIETSGELYLVNYIFFKLERNEKVVLFDVGANDGKYTTVLHNKFNSLAEIHCFEPDMNSFNLLDKAFGSHPKIKLNQFGLSSKKEELILYYDKEGSGWASLFPRQKSEFSKGLEKTQKVLLERLEDYCINEDIIHIDFMKIDVEGYELEVLKGAGEKLKNISFIQFEFSFANFDSKTYLKDFFEILTEFNIYRVLQNGLEKINYDPKLEIFMTTNYLAINKNIT